MTVGSLFSGIGGFDFGLERAGFSIEWQVENNDYCREVLKKHWPAVPCHYDITTIDWEYIPRVDLVCGGFPCQPFSCAGKRQGKDDDRYLWPEVVRCLAVLRPTWFLGENVYGLLHLGIEQVCADLEALGYQVAVLGIPACAVDAPHIRKRLWIVAHADRWRGKMEDVSIRSNGQDKAEAIAHWNGHDVAHSECCGRWESGESADTKRQSFCETERIESSSLTGSSSTTIPDASPLRRRQRHQNARGDGKGTRKAEEWAGSTDIRWWPPEPAICRVVDGIPNRSHRLKGLGNAIVPTIAEALGRMIKEVSA